jgi:hypothetical protein
MSDLLTNKAPPLQAVIDRLICAVGPERVAIVDDFTDDPERVSVVSRADRDRGVIISVADLPEGRYSVIYDELHTKPSGDATVGQTTSSEVLFEGLAWITRTVIEDGFVTGEFERPPKKRRRLHE